MFKKLQLFLYLWNKLLVIQQKTMSPSLDTHFIDLKIRSMTPNSSHTINCMDGAFKRNHITPTYFIVTTLVTLKIRSRSHKSVMYCSAIRLHGFVLPNKSSKIYLVFNMLMGLEEWHGLFVNPINHVIIGQFCKKWSINFFDVVCKIIIFWHEYVM